MKLVQFTDMYGKEVWINPDRVCAVTEFAKDTTIIGFGTNEEKVTVKQPTHAVAHAIWNAGKP